MKVCVFEIILNPMTNNPLLDIDKWFETELGLWILSKVPHHKIQIINRVELDYNLKYRIIADLEPIDYTYWQLKYA